MPCQLKPMNNPASLWQAMPDRPGVVAESYTASSEMGEHRGDRSNPGEITGARRGRIG